MSFLYSGEFQLSNFIEIQIKQRIAHNKNKNMSDGSVSECNSIHVNMAVDFLIDFLRVADEYLLEELKNNC